MKCGYSSLLPMRLALCVALVIALVLAGCTSTSETISTSTSLSSVPATGNLTQQVNLTVPSTATLHLMLAPGLNTSAPVGDETVAMPLGALYPAQGIMFNMTMNGTGNLTGATSALWLRIAQSNVQAGSATDPGCTVSLSVMVRHNGTDSYYAGGCGSLGVGVIPPGDHLIQFSSVPDAFPNVILGPGDGVWLTFTIYLSGPGLGSSAYVLAGSQDRDSWVRLAGLEEPVAPPM